MVEMSAAFNSYIHLAQPYNGYPTRGWCGIDGDKDPSLVVSVMIAHVTWSGLP